MIRALIVDDSLLTRQMLSEILSKDPEIDVVDVASDPMIAREKIKLHNPDVITLDVEMPKLDGLTFLKHLIRLRPTPVVMISALTQKGADTGLQALEAGAVDIIGKPTSNLGGGWAAMEDEIISKVKAAAGAQVVTRTNSNRAGKATRSRTARFGNIWNVVAIGASTGGVTALADVLASLPPETPPILIAQHMPANFIARFAARLNELSSLTVAEAQHEAELQAGHVYIAPGDKHLRLARYGLQYRCSLDNEPPIGGHQPSVDALFDSVADVAGRNGIGVLLTGMGRDGAKGLKAMRDAGGRTVCQDEESSLIYGMPKAAVDLGAVQREVPLSKISTTIVDFLR